jgi:hypothetical protein
MTNRLIGKQKEYKVNGKVVYTSRVRSHGDYHYYITVKDNTLSRQLKFRVKHEYVIGDKFEETLKIGSLGLMYYKEE